MFPCSVMLAVSAFCYHLLEGFPTTTGAYTTTEEEITSIAYMTNAASTESTAESMSPNISCMLAFYIVCRYLSVDYHTTTRGYTTSEDETTSSAFTTTASTESTTEGMSKILLCMLGMHIFTNLSADFPTTSSEANTTTEEETTSNPFTNSTEPSTEPSAASTESTTEGIIFYYIIIYSRLYN